MTNQYCKHTAVKHHEGDVNPVCLDCGKHIDEFVNEEFVNHPNHYNTHPSGVECIDIVEHMTFNTGNAIKYIWRAGQKGDTVEDLEKAKWYIEREIRRIKKKSTVPDWHDH
jgi:hypothetical protein